MCSEACSRIALVSSIRSTEPAKPGPADLAGEVEVAGDVEGRRDREGLVDGLDAGLARLLRST